jgi:hypothetical protein
MLLRRILAPDDPLVFNGYLLERTGISEQASKRALELMLRMLNAEQRARFIRRGHFCVRSPGWGDYEIYPRPVFNVISLDTGICYCAVPDVPVPIADMMLAQKLLLEHMPHRFFAVANQRF